MLESSEKVRVIGGIRNEGEFQPIYATEDGDAVYESLCSGVIAILTNITCNDPPDLRDLSSLQAALESGRFGNALGLLYPDKNSAVVLLDEYTAERRSLGDMETPTGDTFELDPNVTLSDEDADKLMD
jgi:hypothetical protein